MNYGNGNGNGNARQANGGPGSERIKEPLKVYVSAPRTAEGRERAQAVAAEAERYGWRVSSTWPRSTVEDAALHPASRGETLQARRLELSYADVCVVLTSSAATDGTHLIELGDYLRLGRPVVLVAETLEQQTLYGCHHQVVAVTGDSAVAMGLDLAKKMRDMRRAGETEVKKKHGLFDDDKQHQR